MNIDPIPPSYWSGTGNFSDFGIDSLNKRYLWPKKGKSLSLEETIELKMAKHLEWRSADQASDAEGKLRIARFIIERWGGIRRNKLSTINHYLELAEEQKTFRLKGVASYSKILSIVNPNEFAILDARVLVSLNAVQLIDRQKAGILFPYLDGRNSTTGNAVTKSGFRYIERFRQDSSLFDGWKRLDKDAVYVIYLDVLRRISKRLGKNLYLLEMSLFADAEKLAEKCIREIP